MENKYYRDIFESFLKESADSFLVVPSRKVWHSIYNDMHPDRKWPSMAVCLLILSAVMFIGVSNNNSLSSAARNTTPLSYADLSKNNNAVHTDVNTRDQFPATLPVRTVVAGRIDFTALNNVLPTDANNYNSSVIENEQPPLTASVKGIAAYGISAVKNIETAVSVTGAETEDRVRHDLTPAAVKNKIAQKEFKRENTDLSSIIAAGDEIITDNVNTPAGKKTILGKTPMFTAKSAAETDHSWAEDYALKHKPQMNKFKSRAAITYFVTPSYGYRHLTAAAGSETIGGISINDRLKDTRALNLEAGAVVQYNITGNFRIKGGVQVNYNNYVSDVTALGHTLQTSFAPTPQADLSVVSGYEVKPGADRLNRSTVQVSIPVGADLRIAGRNKFKWYVGATVQPSYTIGGSGYVLSQDAKYYIRDKSMLRRLNLNTAVETFISYKPSPGITLSAGPQVRCQVMSSYKQAYKYSEKLYNAGVKIGLTTGF